MRAFLIGIFALLAGGLILLFFYVQNQKPASVIDQSNKAASQLSVPYSTKNGDSLTTPAVPTGEFASVPSATPMSEVVSAQKAIIKTTKGTITLELYPDVAPKTVSNFAHKAQTGFYTNLTFHRVEDWVLQGGDPLGTGTGGGDMPTEFNDKPFVKGAVGVARRSDPSVQNDSQFFIVKTDASWLDKQYTNFGMVTDGMDVVNKMEVGDKILSISVE